MENMSPEMIRERGEIIKKLDKLAILANEYMEEYNDDEFVSICSGGMYVNIPCKLGTNNIPAVQIYKNIEYLAEVVDSDLKYDYDRCAIWFIYKNTIFHEYREAE